MSKKCARCEKTVYPTEELKCLDKIWHKPCFKCKECGMALNMRNYKGFNKEPYCEAHIPKAKATTMAETPELKRIAANTKIQSNVKYHADFEASKGKFTQVADDPEILRIKQNTKIISNVAYHGELQRKAEMEQRRQLNENGQMAINNLDDESTLSMTKQQQQSISNLSNNSTTKQQDRRNANSSAALTTTISGPPSYQPPPPIMNNNNNNKLLNYEGATTTTTTSSSSRLPSSSSSTSSMVSRNSQQTLIFSSDLGGAQTHLPQQHIGSVHDMDPVNENYGSLGRVYRAMYDYEAQDVDEVSFLDGDLIINVSSLDGGWMTGQVKRTGQVGMLPANYVQLATI